LNKCLLFLASLAAFSQAAHYAIQPPKTPQTIISGHGWTYTVPFEVHNVADIEKLISCESQGVNISRPDKGGLYSDGVLQFHRGASDIPGSGTWSDMERRFGFYGSPIIPSEAIHMADLMISNGYLGRWTCARITGLIQA
jgi:hypothetical protein